MNNSCWNCHEEISPKYCFLPVSRPEGDMSQFYLPDFIQTCVAGGYIVFLDCKRDAYTALPKEVTPCLRSLVTDRAIRLPDDRSEIQDPEVWKAVDELLEEGILTTKKPDKTFHNKPRVRLQRDLQTANLSNKNIFDLRFTLFILRAIIFSFFLKNILGLRRTISIMSSLPPRARPSPIPLDELIYTFRYIRPFFYRAKEHCFFDGLVTTYILRKYGFDAVLVFGVSMPEFAAHCWVEVGDTIVTDPLSATILFSPIMAV